MCNARNVTDFTSKTTEAFAATIEAEANKRAQEATIEAGVGSDDDTAAPPDENSDDTAAPPSESSRESVETEQDAAEQKDELW